MTHPRSRSARASRVEPGRPAPCPSRTPGTRGQDRLGEEGVLTLPCPHTAAVICRSWDEAPFIRAGCLRLTSLLDGRKRGCRKPGCTRGLPSAPPPPSSREGCQLLEGHPSLGHRSEALARGVPRNVALSQALPPLGRGPPCPAGARPMSRAAAWHVRASLGQNKGLGRSGAAGVFGPGVAFSRALFVTGAGRA